MAKTKSEAPEPRRTEITTQRDQIEIMFPASRQVGSAAEAKATQAPDELDSEIERLMNRSKKRTVDQIKMGEVETLLKQKDIENLELENRKIELLNSIGQKRMAPGATSAATNSTVAGTAASAGLSANSPLTDPNYLEYLSKLPKEEKEATLKALYQQEIRAKDPQGALMLDIVRELNPPGKKTAASGESVSNPIKDFTEFLKLEEAMEERILKRVQPPAGTTPITTPPSTPPKSIAEGIGEKILNTYGEMAVEAIRKSMQQGTNPIGTTTPPVDSNMEYYFDETLRLYLPKHLSREEMTRISEMRRQAEQDQAEYQDKKQMRSEGMAIVKRIAKDVVPKLVNSATGPGGVLSRSSGYRGPPQVTQRTTRPAAGPQPKDVPEVVPPPGTAVETESGWEQPCDCGASIKIQPLADGSFPKQVTCQSCGAVWG